MNATEVEGWLRPAPSMTRSKRAELVLGALHHFGPRGIVCERVGVLAGWLGVSVDTVRRGTLELLAAGVIEETGLRTGKAKQYRLLDVGSPQPDDGSPQKSTALLAPAAPPSGGRAAGQSERRSERPDFFEDGPPEKPRQRWSQSPMSREDRDHLDTFEWTPELRAEYATRAGALVIRFSRAESVAEAAGLPETSRGPCLECGKEALRRQLGDFEICTTCSVRRLVAGMRDASDHTAARLRIPNERTPLSPPANPVRIRWVRA